MEEKICLLRCVGVSHGPIIQKPLFLNSLMVDTPIPGFHIVKNREYLRLIILSFLFIVSCCIIPFQ